MTRCDLNAGRIANGLHLSRLSTLELRIFHAGYESGLGAGFDIGWAAAEDDMSTAWQQVRRQVLNTVRQPTHLDLQQRRAAATGSPVPSRRDCLASWSLEVKSA